MVWAISLGMPKPWPYDPDIADIVLTRIAQGGNRSALAHVLADDDRLPGVTTWFKWLQDEPDLAKAYTRACEARAEVKAAEIEEIADNPELGETETDKLVDGNVFTEVKRADMLEHRRLRIETRKWIAAKLNPKKYTERQQVEHSGSIHHTVSDLSDDELNAKLLELMTTGRLKLPGGAELIEVDDAPPPPADDEDDDLW